MKYAVDTRVMRSNGRVYVKTEDGLIPLARHVASMSTKVVNGGSELTDQDRVYHIDNTTIGEEGHDDPRNLVVIRFNVEKVRFFRKGVIYTPRSKKLALAAR